MQRLTADNVASAAPRETPYRLFDGKGMFLLVTPAGAKYWRISYRFHRKRKMLSLGVYPMVSLDLARERRTALRELLAEGIDPSEQRKADVAALRIEDARARAAVKFSLDDGGVLSVRLGTRRFDLTPSETKHLRAFLLATRDVSPCH